MQPYLLAPHVFPCVSGQHVVLMDLERDKYVAVAPAHRLAGWVHGWPIGEAQASGARHDADEDAHQLVSRMLAHGMLVTDRQLGKPAVPVTMPRPERSLVEFDFDARPRPRAAHLARFVRSYLRAQLALKLTAIQSIVEAARERKARAVSAASAPRGRDSRSGRAAGDQWHGPTSELHELVTAFTRLRPLFYTVRSACLLDSLTLLHFLATQGICPDWVFGVKTEPFDAHCWIQQGEVLLNDLPDRVRQYSPILVV